jgi:hypothetical protein
MSSHQHTCLNCHKSESEVPLVTIRYQRQTMWVCSQCFPTLIHAPQKFAGKLENADKITPAQHH